VSPIAGGNRRCPGCENIVDMKATKVPVELNDANSLIAFIDLLRLAMKDKDSALRRVLDSDDSPLLARDWQGAARCLEPLKQAVKSATKT
jgi:hypothetical protein